MVLQQYVIKILCVIKNNSINIYGFPKIINQMLKYKNGHFQNRNYLIISSKQINISKKYVYIYYRKIRLHQVSY